MHIQTNTFRKHQNKHIKHIENVEEYIKWINALNDLNQIHLIVWIEFKINRKFRILISNWTNINENFN